MGPVTRGRESLGVSQEAACPLTPVTSTQPTSPRLEAAELCWGLQGRCRPGPGPGMLSWPPAPRAWTQGERPLKGLSLDVPAHECSGHAC